MERLALRLLEVKEFGISPKDDCNTGETMIPDQLVSSRRKISPLFYFLRKDPYLSQGRLVLTYCHCFSDDAGSGAL